MITSSAEISHAIADRVWSDVHESFNSDPEVETGFFVTGVTPVKYDGHGYNFVVKIEVNGVEVERRVIITET